ncbi:GNAT family N-acetyltransferase [Sphingomonas sp. MAH-20]|uniref:GNAT family N-acetyltransferase n=1 Tax=Sphingomonas horti TaxID=2682842 RepID=A0A6I4J0Q8_9SPHN|nr:GNAT family N-acetyltransferase [Sphingomonas sp. CGMCC 1.13658]MBA2921074.1 GNAT family N-acetyltransferase [Sphingomonas sp. CGMCC 1.13658]MVO78139.1 GNAT family N-acetyltransferase [Sphingomonas horti]
MTLTIRWARPGDEAEVLRLVRGLAAYERAPDAVQTTEAMLTETLFGATPQVFAFLAELDGRVVGLALWFLTYSTWTGRPSLYLEDLFVDESARGRGVARALMVRLARETKARDCARMDWAVLDWNVDAMAFYERLGAGRQTGWEPWRLHGDALDALAGEI